MAEKIKVKFDKQFSYAHRGVDVVKYGPGVEEVTIKVAKLAAECGYLNDASKKKVLGAEIPPEDRKAKTLVVMDQLDKGDPERKEESLWTNDGLPEVKAVNAGLKKLEAGFTINAKERDELWAEYQKANTPAE